MPEDPPSPPPLSPPSLSRATDAPAASVRAATPADAVAIGALLSASYGRLFAPAYDEALLARALPLLTMANPVLIASGRYFLVERAGPGALGCGGWSDTGPGGVALPPGTAHLRHFATHPDHLGRGVGRLLYRECARTASAAGITAFHVYASLNAVPFYARLGLAALGQRDIVIAPGLVLPAVEMAGAVR